MKDEGEFSRIARFLAHFPRARVPVGPGDDCAVLAPSREALCVTTDTVVEDVHFSRQHFSCADIGHKALAVNVSDLASMGARPAWFVCALSLPRGFTAAQLTGLARGMAALARAVDIPLVGGNFTSARELSLTLTTAGHVPPGRALLRSGGRVGDVLYVSGTLGDAAAGLSLLARGGGRGGASALVARQRRPLPRVRLGLLARRYASAAIDVSDGLAQDVGHLCAASGVGAELQVEALPLSDALRRHVRPLGREGLAQARQWALAGGEDYELVLAVPPARARAFEAAARRAGEPLTQVGRLVRGRGVRLHTAEGRLLPPPAGFDHFAARGRKGPGGRGGAI